ncbi:MAG: polysaccharide biosynthesis tyrosine autokinase [Candidatus Sulfopaludibacter sp.]|nr:polysaccharide biosynthesis tyrosine autokinase [Candidatus Sulfopaludibacter sp.]
MSDYPNRGEIVSRSYGMGTPVPEYSAADGPRSVPYFRYLYSRKWTLALIALAGLLVGTLIVWRQPYVYRSHSYLEVTGLNDDLLNKREFDPTASRDDSSQVYVNTVARLLQSGPLYSRVAAELNGHGSSPEWNPPITSKEVATNTHVITHDTDRIVEVAADSTDPKRAAAIVNGLTTGFIQQDLDSRWQASNSTSDRLRRQLDDLAAKLRSSEDQLEAFTRNSHLLINGEDSSAGTFVNDIQTELTRAQSDRANKEAEFERASAAGGSAVLPPDGTIDQYQLQLTTLQKQLAEMEATYAPDYYKIPPLKAQIAQLEKAIASQRTAATARVESDYRAAQRRENLLHAQYDARVRNATDQVSKMVQYAALKNQLEMNQSIYSMMMQKVKGYGVAAAMQASNVRVVDPAVPSTIPVRPNKPMTALLISFGFLCIGALILIARAGADHTIMEPGESKQYLRAPELGVIPMASQAGLRSVDGVGVRGRLGAGIALGGAARDSRLETVTWRSSSCLLAESFRSASASLLLPGQGNDDHRVLVVTSLSPGEGKTTVASNLAISLAGVAGKVLLIDGDRRRARLHTVFGCENDRGIADLLNPDGAPNVSVEDCIVQTAVPNLCLLPSGGRGLSSSDLLYSPRMSKLIGDLRRQFNVVLIDTPPLLNLADARVLGRISDGVILVIRAGRVRWEAAMAVEQRLYEDGITVLGTVLNDWDPKQNGYGVYPYDKHIEAYFAA